MHKLFLGGLCALVLAACGSSETKPDAAEIVFQEILYNAGTGDSLEFIELYNRGGEDLELSGAGIHGGVTYTMPAGTRLGKGKYLVLTNDPLLFAERYPGVQAHGPYGGRLANDGESLQLIAADSSLLAECKYSPLSPWPVMAAGQGYSLVYTEGDPEQASSWATSAQAGGSPGAKNEASTELLLRISEVFPASGEDSAWIELENSGSSSIDLGGWVLTKNLGQNGDTLSAGTSIAKNAFLRIDLSNSLATPSRTGEQFVLYRPGTAQAVSLRVPAFAEGASAGGVLLSDGSIQVGVFAQATPEAPNGELLAGEIIIQEVHYNPKSPDAEFVELLNASSQTVLLADPMDTQYAWSMSGIDVEFPKGMNLAPGEMLLLVRAADQDTASFRAQFNVPPSVRILPYTGKLSNRGESLLLRKPGSLVSAADGSIRYAEEWSDQVNYSDDAPWHTSADGEGKSLQRRSPSAPGCDAGSWDAGVPSPGR
jgi:hypothetical protein